MQMTRRDPRVQEIPIRKLYYTVAEACMLLGRSYTLVHYWLDYMDLPYAMQGTKGKHHRKIPAQTVTALLEVERLRREGDLTMQGIKKRIKETTFTPYYGNEVITPEGPPVLGESCPGYGAENQGEGRDSCSSEDRE